MKYFFVFVLGLCLGVLLDDRLRVIIQLPMQPPDATTAPTQQSAPFWNDDNPIIHT